MPMIVTYVKTKLLAAYTFVETVTTYSKIIISEVYSAHAEAAQALFADTETFSESGFLFTQDYIGDDYFEEAGYFATEERAF